MKNIQMKGNNLKKKLNYMQNYIELCMKLFFFSFIKSNYSYT